MVSRTIYQMFYEVSKQISHCSNRLLHLSSHHKLFRLCSLNFEYESTSNQVVQIRPRTQATLKFVRKMFKSISLSLHKLVWNLVIQIFYFLFRNMICQHQHWSGLLLNLLEDKVQIIFFLLSLVSLIRLNRNLLEIFYSSITKCG